MVFTASAFGNEPACGLAFGVPGHPLTHMAKQAKSGATAWPAPTQTLSGGLHGHPQLGMKEDHVLDPELHSAQPVPEEGDQGPSVDGEGKGQLRCHHVLKCLGAFRTEQEMCQSEEARTWGQRAKGGPEHEEEEKEEKEEGLDYWLPEV